MELFYSSEWGQAQKDEEPRLTSSCCTILRNAYIKFATEADNAAGIVEVVNHTPCSRLSNNIYCIPFDTLAKLDARDVKYMFATDEDLRHAQPIWNLSD